MGALDENLAGSEDFESARAEAVLRATILVSARMSGTETRALPSDATTCWEDSYGSRRKACWG